MDNRQYNNFVFIYRVVNTIKKLLNEGSSDFIQNRPKLLRVSLNSRYGFINTKHEIRA